MKQWVLRNLFAAVLGAVIAARAFGQQASRPSTVDAPPRARALIVRIDSDHDQGAGIIVGVDAQWLYIATTDHIAYKADVPTAHITVTFAPPSTDSEAGSVLPCHDADLDLAVIRTPRRKNSALDAAIESFDRVGDTRVLGFGVPVIAIGCPATECWKQPATPDRVVGVDAQTISFDTQRSVHGASGGGLFNKEWEVVGLLIRNDGPRGEAMPIDDVMAHLQAWNAKGVCQVPTSLHQPMMPRTGFLNTVTVTLIAPNASVQQISDDGRLPSGRVSASRRALSGVNWHASVTRFAPKDLAVTAGMIGVSTMFGTGRISIQPFGELGFGHVEGRIDGGGVEILLPDGGLQHEILWQRVSSDGVGLGVGGDVQLILRPRLILDVVAGHWAFTSPPGAPQLPGLFVGAGLRWGR